MKLKERIKKEKVTIPIMLKGYSRSMANAWYGKIQYDYKKYSEEYGADTIAYWHKKGYLCSGIKRYDLIETNATKYITDFQYLYLPPFNNSFGKWLEDILTTKRILAPYGDHFRNVYFSLIRREGKTLILRVGEEDREYKFEDVLDLLREKGALELRPAFWESDRKRHLLTIGNDEETGEEILYSNGIIASENWLKNTLSKLVANYVIADPVPISFAFGKDCVLDHAIKLWIANDAGDEPQILSAMITLYWTDEENKRRTQYSLVDLESGAFEFNEELFEIPNWEGIKEEICRMSGDITQIAYFTATLALSENGGFQFLRFSNNPSLPSVAFNDELNDYLKDKFNKKFRKRTLKDRLKAIREKRIVKRTQKKARPGFRPYMYELWRDTVRSDFWHTKGVSLGQKIWAWKHGFFSWHLYQYGITKGNYSRFLSDYDYYWLNRINNDYQKWLNDKTTYRFVMEPFKEYLPKYYFSLFVRDGQVHYAKMWDCPEGTPDGFEGLTALLREKGKLAVKASAGTHGDGFYCFAYEDGQYLANGENVGEEGLQKILGDIKSFYIVTEYLEMHADLKKIYAKSVNTVRMMVINAHGYDPKIMQTYMRIGSEKTGFTDNVGYGGICVFIDKETGELYKPETIKDHVFYDCPVHPDTGTPIAGFLPHWQLVREKVLEICRYLCELEYLGLDIAITDDGFQILEINIHQDLHKVATYDKEIMDFFRRKIALKRKQN